MATAIYRIIVTLLLLFIAIQSVTIDGLLKDIRFGIYRSAK